MWLLTLPDNARIFLRELKNLALLEFIPYEWLMSKQESEQLAQQSSVSQELGIERFGTNSLIGGMGSMLVIGIAVIALVLVLVIFRVIASKSRLFMKLYLKLKQSKPV